MRSSIPVVRVVLNHSLLPFIPLLIFILIIVLPSSLSWGSGKNDNLSRKEVLELGIKCNEQSQMYFKRVYGVEYEGFQDGYKRSEYRSHYNVKLNKCFMLYLSSRTYWNDMNIMSYELIDVIENRQYGCFLNTDKQTKPDQCFVTNKVCNNMNEWFILVNTYMEN